MTLSKREAAERTFAGLLGDAIHESAHLINGSPQPVTDLYNLLVAAGRHEVVEEPYRPGGES